MSSILYNLIISPIELLVEVIFELMFRIVGQRETNQGLAVIGVSLAISLLTLPLYRRADAVQQKERDLQKKLSRWTSHIRKTFKGDERFMMQQAYYRENGYSPLMALNGSISLLLEIPFFIAAYHFLSHLQALEGASFGPIANLGKPDGLIKLGSLSLNLLPILMTSINCISSAVYLKGFPLKDKIQTYGMALIFLVLLYNSPSGLVVYWTCNNIFSLVKNIFYKLKNPHKVAAILCAVLGTLLCTSLFASGILNSKKKYIATALLLVITCIPLLLYIFKNKLPQLRKDSKPAASLSSFILPALLLTILTGILIPSAVLASSPAEFIDVNHYQNPLHFLLNSFCYSAGFFLVWSFVIYKMLDDKGRTLFSLILTGLSVAAIVNFMCFGRNLGILSTALKFDNEPSFSVASKLLNLFLNALIFAAIIFIWKFKKTKTILRFANLVLLICIISVSFVNISNTQKKVSKMDYLKNMSRKTSSDSSLDPVFTLSRTGKNVIVFMLDRAINGFFPLFLEERPELKEQFSGFNYYPNTISFGAHTIFGAAPIFGGYEYTPKAMNERKDKTLVEKHNEALKVLPVLFLENNYNVTVCDPPFANYEWIPDVSIYDEYPQMHTHITEGMYFEEFLKKYNLNGSSFSSKGRNFFCYSLFKIAPVAGKSLIYDDGDYFSTNAIKENVFYDSFATLDILPELTSIDDSSDNFIMIANDATHFPIKLYLPDYTVIPSVSDNEDKAEEAARKHKFETENQLVHYHTNIASIMALGRWFDYLKEKGVYDNTRIIIVSDHGFSNSYKEESLGFFDNLKMENPKIDVMMVNPILLVKDFNAKELTIRDDFMTNGDVPVLATKDIIPNAANPFTGKALSSSEKTSGKQFITSCHKVLQNENDIEFDLSDGRWFSVHDSIFKEENWELEN